MILFMNIRYWLALLAPSPPGRTRVAGRVEIRAARLGA